MIKEEKRDQRRRKCVIRGKIDEGEREYGKDSKGITRGKSMDAALSVPLPARSQASWPCVCPVRRLDLFKGLSESLFSWPHGRHLTTSPLFLPEVRSSSQLLFDGTLSQGVSPKSCKMHLTLGCLLLHLSFSSLVSSSSVKLSSLLFLN